MKVKIFSVRADENFQTIRVGDKTRRFSANVFLEGEIQKFLDDNIFYRQISLRGGLPFPI